MYHKCSQNVPKMKPKYSKCRQNVSKIQLNLKSKKIFKKAIKIEIGQRVKFHQNWVHEVAVAMEDDALR